MDVYIEYVILDNFTITFFIAVLTYKIMLKRVAKLRVMFAAAVGTGVAIVYPYVYNDVLVMLIKLGLWFVLSLMLFVGKRKFLLCSLVFFAVTFLFGGLVFGLNYLVCGDVYAAMRASPFNIPISIIFIAVATGYCVSKKIAVALHRRKDALGAIYDFSLTLFGKTVELRGLMDTGNRLYDEKSGLPIVIIGIKYLTNVLNEKQLIALTTGRGESLQREARYIKISTVVKDVKILLLKPDSFILYSDKGEHILYDVTVGVSFAAINDSVKYAAILHPALAYNQRPETEIRRSA